jgi:hypothetical protein
MTANLETALAATAETDAFDFKISFDAAAPGAWCELVKDLVAIGNSGGGSILIGVDRNGHTVGAPVGSQKALDPAAIGDQVRKYTGGSDPRCSVHYLDRQGRNVLVILIASVRTPVAFEQAGTYAGVRKNECAFQAGSFYFRRNTKSAPGTTEDLAVFIEREVARRREEWLGSIRQVMEAPAGSRIAFSAIAPETAVECRPIRLSNEPDAERCTTGAGMRRTLTE